MLEDGLADNYGEMPSMAAIHPTSPLIYDIPLHTKQPGVWS